jgi:hypothetical protein
MPNGELVSRDELRTLAEERGQPSVSLYMPIHRVGPEGQQNPIRLRNLLTEAEKRLLALGAKTPEVQAMLAPGEAMLSRRAPSENPGLGLALFMSDEQSWEFRLPFAVEELLVVAQRFHLQPLLRALRPDGVFYVLALSQKQARLLEGTRHAVREIDLDNVPQGLAEALRGEEPVKSIQFHTATSAPGGRGGDRPAIFHGHGGGEEAGKSDILRYFHQVDHGLREWLGTRQAPLVLAGVEYLLPLYQEANSYPHLVADGLTGNPDDLRAEELHARAWEIVRPLIIQPREAAVEKFKQLSGAGSPLASTEVGEIVAAAYYGRVESLFARLGAQQWGRFDPETGQATLESGPTADNEDLLDMAAVQAYLNRGAVYVVPADQMPGWQPLAATFRY